MTAEFNWSLNRQGPRGQQGPQGKEGFSPVITIAENTAKAYILRIQTQDDTFLTPNLRGTVEDLGGTYVRYNPETGMLYAGSPDIATTENYGMVKVATPQDVTDLSQETITTPSIVNDMIVNNNIITSTKADVDSIKGNYVTTNTAQTITGHKEFNNNTLTLGADGSGGYSVLFSSPVSAYVNGEWSKQIASMMWTSPTGKSGDERRYTELIIGPNVVINGEPYLKSIEFRAGGLVLSNPADSVKYNIISTKDIATTDKAGIVKPDGSTILIDENGVISSKGGGSSIDDANTSTQSTWSSSKISGEISTVAQEVVGVQGDVASLNADVSALKPVVESHTTSIGAINDSIALAMTDITKLKEGKQDKLIAGPNILIEGNVISSTASGGAAIDDINPSAETVYSSSKVEELLMNYVPLSTYNELLARVEALENEINGGSADGPSTVAVRGATTSTGQASYVSSEAGQAESSAEEQQQQ